MKTGQRAGKQGNGRYGAAMHDHPGPDPNDASDSEDEKCGIDISELTEEDTVRMLFSEVHDQ